MRAWFPVVQIGDMAGWAAEGEKRNETDRSAMQR